MIELRLEVFNELFIQHGSGKSNGNHSAQSPADVQAGRNFRSCEKGTFLADSRKCSLARFSRKEKADAHWDF